MDPLMCQDLSFSKDSCTILYFWSLLLVKLEKQI